jgi:hypothetical protein
MRPTCSYQTCLDVGSQDDQRKRHKDRDQEDDPGDDQSLPDIDQATGYQHATDWEKITEGP